MIVDPITEEIRAIRHTLAAQYDNDVKRIFEAVRQAEQASGREFVSLPPRAVGKPIAAKRPDASDSADSGRG
jgi:hypothetical protein